MEGWGIAAAAGGRGGAEMESCNCSILVFHFPWFDLFSWKMLKIFTSTTLQGLGCVQRCPTRRSSPSFGPVFEFLVSESFYKVSSYMNVFQLRLIHLNQIEIDFLSLSLVFFGKSFPLSNINKYFHWYSSRKGWILGVLVSIMLPFLRNKWGPLFKLTSKHQRAFEVWATWLFSWKKLNWN